MNDRFTLADFARTNIEVRRGERPEITSLRVDLPSDAMDRGLSAFLDLSTGAKEFREKHRTPSRVRAAYAQAGHALSASERNDFSAIDDGDATTPAVPTDERSDEQRLFCPVCIHPSVLLTHLRAPDSRDDRRVLVDRLRPR